MWATIASFAGPVLGAAMLSGAAEDAAAQQGQSSATAIAEQRRQYDTTRKDLSPYRDIGVGASSRLGTLLGIEQPGSATSTGAVQYSGQNFDSLDSLRQMLVADYVRQGGDPSSQQYQTSLEDVLSRATSLTPSSETQRPEGFGDLTKKFTLADFWDDPVTKASYQMGLDTGTKALSNAASKNGNLNSGAAMKALTRFGVDYTGGQAAGSQARFVGDQNNTYNRLMGVTGVGQNAAGMGATAGANSATNIGNIMTAQGNAAGASSIASGNAYGNALSGIGNNINQQMTLDKIINGRGSSATGSINYNPTGSRYSMGGEP